MPGFTEEQMNRNRDALHLEQAGNVLGAIELYEQNIAESFEGSLPYDRLLAFYGSEGRLSDEIRVLKKAVEVFDSSLNRFKDGLSEAQSFLRK